MHDYNHLFATAPTVKAIEEAFPSLRNVRLEPDEIVYLPPTKAGRAKGLPDKPIPIRTFTAEYHPAAIRCPVCKKEHLPPRRGPMTNTFKHFDGVYIDIIVKLGRRVCGGESFTTPRPPEFQKGHFMTRDGADFARTLGVELAYTKAAQMIGVSDTMVRALVIERLVEPDTSGLRAVGIDTTKRGDRRVVSLVSIEPNGERRLIDARYYRKRSDRLSMSIDEEGNYLPMLKFALKAMLGPARPTVVLIDLDERVRSAVRFALKNSAAIVVDPFHLKEAVQQAAARALKGIRARIADRRERRRLKAAWSALLTNPNEAGPRARELQAEWSRLPEVLSLLSFTEALHRVYASGGKRSAERALRDAIAHARTVPGLTFGRRQIHLSLLLDRLTDEILGRLEHRLAYGATEQAQGEIAKVYRNAHGCGEKTLRARLQQRMRVDPNYPTSIRSAKRRAKPAG